MNTRIVEQRLQVILQCFCVWREGTFNKDIQPLNALICEHIALKWLRQKRINMPTPGLLDLRRLTIKARPLNGCNVVVCTTEEFAQDVVARRIASISDSFTHNGEDILGRFLTTSHEITEKRTFPPEEDFIPLFATFMAEGVFRP